MLIKNKIFLWKRKTTAFWQKNTAKTRHFGKITAFTAFDENHGFRDMRYCRDFRVSVIIYCPYTWLERCTGNPDLVCCYKTQESQVWVLIVTSVRIHKRSAVQSMNIMSYEPSWWPISGLHSMVGKLRISPSPWTHSASSREGRHSFAQSSCFHIHCHL